MKKWILLSTLLLSVGTLYGCSSDKAVDPKPSATPQATTETAVISPTPSTSPVTTIGEKETCTDPELVEGAGLKAFLTKQPDAQTMYNYSKTEYQALTKDEKTLFLKALFEAQQKQIESLLASQPTSLSTLTLEQIKTPERISDADVQTYVTSALKSGLTLDPAEGMFEPKIDYLGVQIRFGQDLSTEMSAYLAIHAAEAASKTSSDGALLISLDELRSRILTTESFISKHSKSSFKDEISDLNRNYLHIYLLGLNNTPAFGADNVMSTEWKEHLQQTIKAFPDSTLSDILSNYLVILKTSHDQKNEAVLSYVNEKAKTDTPIIPCAVEY